jgi:endonuclease YncB( thermonuclease family)
VPGDHQKYSDVKKIFASIILLIWANLAAAEEYDAKVIVVIDGDTLVVLHNGAKVKVRLGNIDAPEKNQAFGMDARQAMFGMVFKKIVHIDSIAVDKYGRTVALVSIGNFNVNKEMVRRGMAWEYSYYKPGRVYMALQSEAQQARRGLWSQRNPIAPWVWRRTHPSTKSGISNRESKRSTSHSRVNVFNDSSCGGKTHCSQMNSCAEAYFYLNQCGVKTLDKTMDGVPCKKLCEGKN